ncbi:META domain-containing protein [Elizabethkingia anophelis]|uniref:META domain-containing protein n=1 Tax=Elizabethkingia anophelis TaxID=1117645 RepID=UPI0038917A8B
MRKHLTLITAGILLFANSCNTVQNTNNNNNNTSQQNTMPENTVLGKKWKLIELNGKPVADKVNGKEPYLKLLKQDKEYRYEASGGCNGIGGNLKLTGFRIQFAQGMSTMMACEDMSIEQGLSKALIAADNYTVSKEGDVLSINKARMAPLARFRAVAE